MATISDTYLSRIEEWYNTDGMSASDIAQKLGTSLDAVYYFMRCHKIARRKQWESNDIRYSRQKPSFNLRNVVSEELRGLKLSGVMLYWAEGSKWHGETQVDFANSDKDMILLFLRFLREVCGIDEQRLRVFGYFYSNQDVDRNIKYWSDLTNIPKSQFTKPYIRKDYKPEKQDRMPYGLVHIRYTDKKLLLLIRSWINEYKKEMCLRC